MSGPLAPVQVGLVDLLPPFDVAVDANTGAASYSYALPLPNGRLGFGPGLALNYQDAAGNSPFGFGWMLGGMAAISVFDQRKAPHYDATDRYALAGEELVPALSNGPGAPVALEWDTATHHNTRSTAQQPVSGPGPGQRSGHVQEAPQSSALRTGA